MFKILAALLLAAAGLSVASCQLDVGRAFADIDRLLSEDFDSTEMFFGEQRMWAGRIGARNPMLGNIVAKVASLEAEVAAKEHAIKQKLMGTLRTLIVERFSEELASRSTRAAAQQKAHLLAARGLLRGKATILRETLPLWQQIYQLASYYMQVQPDDRYIEVALGMSGSALTLANEIELQSSTLAALPEFERQDVDLQLEKQDILLSRKFQCASCAPVEALGGVVPLATSSQVDNWVREYVPSSFLQSIQETNARISAQGLPNLGSGSSEVGLDVLEGFRRGLLERNGLLNSH